jgi:hypothetical protein
VRRAGASSSVGGTTRFGFQEVDLMTAVERLPWCSQMVVALVSLGHKKGRVRFLLLAGAHASRNLEQRWSGEAAWWSSSSQT